MREAIAITMNVELSEEQLSVIRQALLGFRLETLGRERAIAEQLLQILHPDGAE